MLAYIILGNILFGCDKLLVMNSLELPKRWTRVSENKKSLGKGQWKDKSFEGSELEGDYSFDIAMNFLLVYGVAELLIFAYYFLAANWITKLSTFLACVHDLHLKFHVFLHLMWRFMWGWILAQYSIILEPCCSMSVIWVRHLKQTVFFQNCSDFKEAYSGPFEYFSNVSYS